MNKRLVKGKGNAAVTIALCACMALLVELVACVFVSIGTERGVVTEQTLSVAAHVLRVFGTVIATVLAWIFERDNKMLSAGVAAAVTTVVPAVAAMLFWGLDGGSFAVSLVICVLVFFLSVWGMGALGSKRTINRYKKHYR